MREVKVVAKGLTKRYGDVVAADGVDITVHAEEIVGIVGPNGAGKTTVIEMMEGLRKPDAGSCHICGFDSIRENQAVRERIGLSLQQAGMPDEVSVIEMLRLYSSFYPDAIPVGDLLHQFGLTEKARTRTERLSGGQRQRLALALALIGRPEVIFLDEPTTGLDPQARRALWDVIRSLKQDGRGIIVSTHYMDEVERLCDRVVVLDHGRVLAEGTPRALMAAHGPESVIEVELTAPELDTVAFAQLDAVTGLKVEEDYISLYTSYTAKTLMSLAQHAQHTGLPLGDLRTRSASMDDVFIALTGRSIQLDPDGDGEGGASDDDRYRVG